MLSIPSLTPASLRSALILSVLLAAAAAPLGAQRVTTQLVSGGLQSPIFLTSPPGDTQRLFIIEENVGRIRILDNGVLLGTPFLDVGAKITSSGEQGLLGMAFHPNYATNGYFYINYTDNGGDTVVSRYTVSGNPNVANAASEFVILTQSQPFSNHNGGMIAFGPNDGYLYIGFGDGGSGGDPFNNAQTGGTWLGKMLRIDVDGGSPYAVPPSNPFVGVGGFLPEIWVLGLRNPWRFSFDPANGDLWIGDVGQNTREEISYQSGSSAGGENYGWRIMEGTRCYNPSTGCNQTGLTLPAYDYAYGATNGTCVIGGYVYRGSAIPGLQGTYFFCDYTSDKFWSFRYVNGQVTEFRERTAELAPGGGLDLRDVASFGEDVAGELYMMDRIDGEVFKMVPDLMDLAVTPLVAGQSATATVSAATAGGTVYFAFSVAGLGVTAVPLLNVWMGIVNPQLVGSAAANGTGVATLNNTVPAGAQGLTVWVQAAEQGNTSTVVQGVVQ